MFWKPLVIVGFLINILLSPQGGLAAELLVGTATADITPAEPVRMPFGWKDGIWMLK